METERVKIPENESNEFEESENGSELDAVQEPEAVFEFPEQEPDNSDAAEKETLDLESLRKKIEAVESIDELCNILSLSPELAGSEGVKSEDVVRSIRDIEAFLNEHITDIVTGVINKGAEYYRDRLGQKLLAVQLGGDLDIRGKVKELLKTRMGESFKENKTEYAEGAVIKSNSFDQLYGVIKQFKGVNAQEAGRALKITAEQSIEAIGVARDDLEILLEDHKFLNNSPVVVRRNIKDLIQNVPQDSGIRVKVEYLLNQRFEAAKFESFSKDSQKSFGSGVLGRFKKLFGRRRK